MANDIHIKDVENQALSYLQDYALSAYIFFIATHTFIAYFIYLDFPSQWVGIWLVSFISLQTVSLLLRQWVPSSNLSHQEKLVRGMSINIFDGLMVSSCLLFINVSSQGTIMMMITILLISSTGAITTTIGYKKFYNAFTIPIFSIIFIALAPLIYSLQGNSGILALTISTAIIVFVLYQISARIFLNFNEAFFATLMLHDTNKELKAAVQSAKKANESKTRFLASASHDLRQPINVLSLFVANLTLKDSEGEYTDIINHMNAAINSVDAQLESLLDISKLDAGVVDVKLTETNLAKLTEDLVSGYPNTDSVSIRYTSQIEDVIVETDVALFERILNNLVSNSIKYTSEGYIEVNLKCENDEAILTIKDTGIGIKPADLNKIFDEFYQVNNLERSSVNGLGLGLSIVKRLSDLLNIKVSLNSHFGIGTEVEIKMDYKRASEPFIFQIESPTIANESDSKRVIVLDNELSIVQAVKSVLETMNHHVEIFTNSSKALRCFEKQRFDLALIDYRLAQGVLGSEVINKMILINNKTKFFLITGDNNVIQSDSFELIHKPVTSKKLEYIFNK